MTLPDLIGFIAGTLTTICFLPQVIKSYRTKQLDDLSLATFVILSTGQVLWLIYGIMLSSKPIIIFNALTITTNSSLIYMKIKYSRKTPKQSPPAE